MKELIERLRDIGEVSECYDAADALEQQAKRIAELEVSQCTSPWADSPPCKGIQRERDRVEELEAENARLLALCGEDKRALDKFNQQLQSENSALLANNKELRAELAAAYETAETTARRQLARIEELMAQLAAAQRGLSAVRDLIDESQGVYGLHLNGDGSPWEELRTGGRFETWLADFDAAIAKEKAE